jgi:hypothetical protein
VAEEVGTVRRHVDHDAIVVQRERLQQERTRRRLGFEFPQSIGIGADAELARRAEHALRELTAELCLLDAHRATALPHRHRGTDGSEGVLPAGGDVGRAAHDLPPLHAAVVHGTDTQAIGVGMLAHLFHKGHANFAQSRIERLDDVHRRALRSQARADVPRVQGPTQETFEPPAGDVHGVPPCGACPAMNCERKRMSPS